MNASFRTVLSCALLLAACAKAAPSLEQQAQRSDVRKRACEERPAPDYEPAPGTEGLSVETLDCGYAYPSEITISDDGRWAFVAELKGAVYVYAKVGERFELQDAPFHDLGELGVEDEAGLTGITLAPRFDVESDAPEDHDVFLAYQSRGDDGVSHNRVLRLSAELQDGELVARDAREIFTSDNEAMQAHQIHGGVAFELRGETHVIFPIGGAHGSANVHDPGAGEGTLTMMRRGGEEPLGPHPWPQYPQVRAYGVRNAYGLEMLPAELDPRRGLVGIENGDHVSDRAWLAHPIDFEAERVHRIDLGYDGSDRSDGWANARDPAVPDARGEPRRAVFHLFHSVVSPTAVSVHPGRGMIPPSNAQGISLVTACFGRSGTNDLGPGKDIELVRLENVAEGELRSSEAKILVQRKASTFGEFMHPVALDVDPTDGSIYFADIITGVLFRVRVAE